MHNTTNNGADNNVPKDNQEPRRDCSVRITGWVHYNAVNKLGKSTPPLRIDETYRYFLDNNDANDELAIDQFLKFRDAATEYSRTTSTRDAVVELDTVRELSDAITYLGALHAQARGPDRSDAWALKSFTVHAMDKHSIHFHTTWEGLEPSSPDRDNCEAEAQVETDGHDVTLDQDGGIVDHE